MNRKMLIIAISVLPLLSGCSTLFGNNNRLVQVTSQPSGAQVYLNGQPMGTTPATVQVPSPNNNYVRVEKTGYQSNIQMVDSSFQPVGVLNILFWPGFIVDAVTGDMMKVSNPDMHFNLQPVSVSS